MPRGGFTWVATALVCQRGRVVGSGHHVAGRSAMSPLFGPDAGRVQLKGTRIPGTIIGIETNVTSTRSRRRASATTPSRPAARSTASARISLPTTRSGSGCRSPWPFDGTAAVIEWGDSGTVPLEDAEDPARPRHRRRPRRQRQPRRDEADPARHRRSSVTLLEFSVRKVALGPRANRWMRRCARCPTAASRIETTIQAMQQAPGYAAHLL